jgi:hypothetical protein
LAAFGYVNCIAVDPTNSSNAIVLFSNYVFQSLWYTSNRGSGWTYIEGNLSGNTGPSACRAAIFYVSGTSHHFPGTSICVYFTITLLSTTPFFFLKKDYMFYNIELISTRQELYD